MADWIKMRSSLLTNPKVIRMAKVLLTDPEFMEWLCPGECVTSDVTVTKRRIPVVTRVVAGALIPTWSAVNDTAARDGILRHAASQDIDETAGVPGFGKALIAVEWLRELPNEEGVQFVNFEEHNSTQKERSLTSKSGAERTKEYRERKKALEADPSHGDVTGDADVTSQRDDREEEKRVEKKRKKKGAKAPLSVDNLPTWMESLLDLWHEVLPELPGVAVMNDERRQVMTDFREWVFSAKRRDGTARATNDEEFLAWSRDYLTRARNNDFIMGRGKRSPEHANWRCPIEFLLSAKGMQKVIEQTTEDAT